VVRAFNQIDAAQIASDGTPKGTPNRRALGYAGNDPEAKKLAADLYDEFGFDAVDVGGLDDAWRLDVDQPTFVVRMNQAELVQKLAEAHRHVTSYVPAKQQNDPVTVRNAELATVHEAMRDLPRLLAQLDAGTLDKLVLTQRNQMRAVLISVERVRSRSSPPDATPGRGRTGDASRVVLRDKSVRRRCETARVPPDAESCGHPPTLHFGRVLPPAPWVAWVGQAVEQAECV
jgi:hypothetical protein